MITPHQATVRLFNAAHKLFFRPADTEMRTYAQIPSISIVRADPAGVSIACGYFGTRKRRTFRYLTTKRNLDHWKRGTEDFRFTARITELHSSPSATSCPVMPPSGVIHPSEPISAGWVLRRSSGSVLRGPTGWYKPPKDNPMPRTQTFKSSPAVLDSADGNLQSVFAVGADGYVYQTFHSRVSEGDDWRNWMPWTALPKTTRFQSTPAATNSPDGKVVDLFVLGRTGRCAKTSTYADPEDGGAGGLRCPGPESSRPDWQP